MSRPETIVFFGKGGIGKSTISSNVSALLGATGRKVLHAGCDPKLDSTLSLAGRHIPPFSGAPGPDAGERLRGFIQRSAVRNVYCVEAGGPRAGVGCAGAGIGALLEAIKESGIMTGDDYGAAVFDVLGDVVCGGFAAPLRRGFARKVVIVTSAEALSLYSANRLIAMTENYSRNGARLAGLVLNCRDSSDTELAVRYAREVNVPVLGLVPRDPAVKKAEREHVPAALAYPRSPFAASLLRLTSAILKAPLSGRPRPLSDAAFWEFVSGRTTPSRPAASRGDRRRSRGGVAAAFRRAGLRPAYLEGGQIVCDWSVPGGTRRLVIAPAGPGTAGRLLVSDWAACVHPSSDESASGGETAGSAVAPLEPFLFEELLSYFGTTDDFHGTAGRLGTASNFTDLKGEGDLPRRPHLGAGQWHRFFFPRGSVSLVMPPDLAVAEHGDPECRFCEASGGPLSFFGVEGSSLPALPKGGGNVFSTGFGPSEAAAGEEALVKKALSAAAGSAGKGGLVELYSTCGPMLLAGDTASAAEEAEREHGVTVLRENYNSYSEYSREKAAARSRLILAGLRRAAKPGAGRRDISFFGYPHLNASLRSSLEAAGLEISGAEGFYESLVSAKLQVLPAYDAALCPALEKAGIGWIVPPEPYGFSGTGAWFGAIFRALSRSRRRACAPDAAIAAEFSELKKRAGKYDAALVSSPGEISELGSLGFLNALAEAGFGIRLLVRRDGAPLKSAARAAGELRAKLGAARFTSAFFSSPRELAALLRSPSRLRLVYSDVRRDARVLRAGRTPFSRELFKPGYDGAVESARRLLRLCEWDFSRRLAER